MLWSTRGRPRGGKRVAPGFIEPCQAVLATTPPVGADWIHEIKYDGYRLICMADNGRPRIWTRPGNEVTRDFSGIAEALEQLGRDVVMDGEGICQHINGNCDFYALRSKAGKSRALLMAFDLMVLDGVDLRARPCEERRAILHELVSGISGSHILFSEAIEGAAGQDLFVHACRAGLEGIVSKKRGSRYRSGKFDAWRKIKCGDYSRA